MGKFLKVAALLCCLGVLVRGIIALDSNGSLLSSFPGCSAGKIAQPEATEESEQIARIEKAWLRHLDTKWQIAEEVIAQRLSLAEAMQRFRALDQEWPQVGSATRKAHDLGISEDEWEGRVVINTVKLYLVRGSDKTGAVIDRLEKELQEILAERKKHPAAPIEPSSEPRR